MTKSGWAFVILFCSTIDAGRTFRSGDPLPGLKTRPAARLQSSWQDVVRNLRHPDAKVRLDAVEQLGNAGYTTAAESVAPLVTDADDRVQFAAIDAELTFFLVEPIGGRRILALAGRSSSRAQEAFNAGVLVRAAAPAPAILIGYLITAMRDENTRIRFDAVHALGVIAEAPLPSEYTRALLDGLDHYDPVIRAATARVIGRLGVRDAGDKLIAALNDSSAVVRRYATEALGRIREERAITSLTELVSFHRNSDMAAETLLALARIGHPSARDLFRARIADANPEVRRAAVEGLGRAGDRDSLPTLESIAQSDRNAAVKLAALFALDRLKEPQSHLIAGAAGSSAVAEQAREYLLEIGKPAAAGVTSALGAATNPNDRAELIHLLGYLGTPETISIVQPFVKDPNERVSRAAANAVARLGR